MIREKLLLRKKVFSAARRFTDHWQHLYSPAVDCLRADLDELLTCFRYKTRDKRKAVRTLFPLTQAS